jgi:hypothetical protein
MDETTACEVKAFGHWTPLDFDAALKLASSRTLHCPECHGQVRAHRACSNGTRAHMEHHERHKGCSCGDCFDGLSRPHHRIIP